MPVECARRFATFKPSPRNGDNCETCCVEALKPGKSRWEAASAIWSTLHNSRSSRRSVCRNRGVQPAYNEVDEGRHSSPPPSGVRAVGGGQCDIFGVLMSQS